LAFSCGKDPVNDNGACIASGDSRVPGSGQAWIQMIDVVVYVAVAVCLVLHAHIA
jgi:hypothetical protein